MFETSLGNTGANMLSNVSETIFVNLYIELATSIVVITSFALSRDVLAGNSLFSVQGQLCIFE